MADHPKGIRSPLGLETVARVRDLVRGFPEVVEAVDKFGHTSFRVRDKPFVMLGEHEGEEIGPALSIKGDSYTQKHLIEHRGWERTAYIGQHGWATLRALPPDDWDEIGQLLHDAYLRVAPASLARRLQDDA